MRLVPAATKETTPEVFTEAIVGMLLLHVPPVVELLSVLVVPSHPARVPVIKPGTPFTVTTVVLRHPVDAIVYEMVAVPAPTPFMTP